MASLEAFKLNKLLGRDGDEWPGSLTVDEITKARYPDAGQALDAEYFRLKLNQAVDGGQLGFNIGVRCSWHYPDVSVAILGHGNSPTYARHLRELQNERDLTRYAAHTPDNGWIAFLDGVGFDGSKALEGHACGCTAICTVESVFNNGLPKRWRVEGMHDDGLKISFTCRAYPLLTPERYFNFCADNGIPDPKGSLLADWFGKGNQLDELTKANAPTHAKPLNPKSTEERLNKLKEFISKLESISKTQKVEFDKMDLPLTKPQVLDELNKRYKKNFDIKIDAFDVIWKSATNAGICANNRANTTKGENFLKSIF